MAPPTGRQLALDQANRTSRDVAPARGAPPWSSDGPSQRNTVRPLNRGRQVLFERAAELADKLSALLAERVRLTITDNTSTMVSFKRSGGVVSFRVHQMFVDAPPEVVLALADYASKGRRSSGSVIDAFVRANEARVRRSRIERQAKGLDPYGRFHDLQAMFDELNRRYFDGRIDARIGWGREAPGRRRRSIKMGTYFHDARVIRIHPALDRAEVPGYFVAFVIFHEMLHQAVPPKLIGGRRVAHSDEFRRHEAAYPDYARALAWEAEHLSLLLGDKPRRIPFDPDDPLA